MPALRKAGAFPGCHCTALRPPALFPSTRRGFGIKRGFCGFMRSLASSGGGRVFVYFLSRRWTPAQLPHPQVKQYADSVSTSRTPPLAEPGGAVWQLRAGGGAAPHSKSGAALLPPGRHAAPGPACLPAWAAMSVAQQGPGPAGEAPRPPAQRGTDPEAGAAAGETRSARRPLSHWAGQRVRRGLPASPGPQVTVALSRAAAVHSSFRPTESSVKGGGGRRKKELFFLFKIKTPSPLRGGASGVCGRARPQASADWASAVS